MFLQRRRPGQKRLKGRLVGILDFAVLVPCIQVLIKKIAEIYLFEGILFALRLGIPGNGRILRSPVLQIYSLRNFLFQHLLQNRVFHQFLVQHLLEFQLVELEKLNLLKQRGGEGKPLAET
jgi:hypothetical protein